MEAREKAAGKLSSLANQKPENAAAIGRTPPGISPLVELLAMGSTNAQAHAACALACVSDCNSERQVKRFAARTPTFPILTWRIPLTDGDG